jgi:hypothetical protein
VLGSPPFPGGNMFYLHWTPETQIVPNAIYTMFFFLYVHIYDKLSLLKGSTLRLLLEAGISELPASLLLCLEAFKEELPDTVMSTVIQQPAWILSE